MADAGFKDIFIPYNIIGESKLAKLTALAKRITVSVTADSAVTVRGLSDAAQRAGLILTVLVECDTGAGRCGVQSPQQAAELAGLIAQLPGLRFGGLMTYPTDKSLDAFVNETRQLLAKDNIKIDRVNGCGRQPIWQLTTTKE